MTMEIFIQQNVPAKLDSDRDIANVVYYHLRRRTERVADDFVAFGLDVFTVLGFDALVEEDDDR